MFLQALVMIDLSTTKESTITLTHFLYAFVLLHLALFFVCFLFLGFSSAPLVVACF
jgi:hypothetical protein